MDNENIKEILDKLKKTADNTTFIICGSKEELDKAPKYTANFLSINDKKAKLLLDYITKIQLEKEDYKSRCEKAIEYLKSYNTDFEHCRFNEAPISLRELGNLLNILQNGSEDNE